ncbi:MAG: methyltransferase domain-containing protein [Chloroflexota bacterium]
MGLIQRIVPPALEERVKTSSAIYLARSVLQLEFEIRMLITTATAKRQFAQFNNASNLRLNLGCGFDIREGWLNVDIENWKKRKPDATGAFVAHDLRRPLPLPDQSCDYIYSSHFWEHLDYQTGYAMMQDVFRMLKPGGTFRVVVPDYLKYSAAYVNGDDAFFTTLENAMPDGWVRRVPGAECVTDHMHFLAYQWGEHKCLYDPERMEKMLKVAGFTDVRQVDFDPDMDIDHVAYTGYSLYMEATRP